MSVSLVSHSCKSERKLKYLKGAVGRERLGNALPSPGMQKMNQYLLLAVGIVALASYRGVHVDRRHQYSGPMNHAPGLQARALPESENQGL